MGKQICLVTALATAVLVTAPPLVAQSEEADRLTEATTVLRELKDAPDVSVPDWVREKAVGIAVFPSVKKGAFVVGGHFGRGVLSARSAKSGTWSAPAFLTLTGGSVGFQVGGEATDVVLAIMDDRGLEQLLRNQFKIGADATVAAGPVGRQAEASTDLQMRAQILSYSRSRGLFAGVSLEGSTVKQDRDAHERFYGRSYSSKEIVFERLGGAPDPVAAWRTELARTFQKK